MVKRLVWVVMILSAVAANVAAQGAEKLPVRRVVLYKNGIGYFEHTGRVTGNQELTIEFTSAQLNDVLKSLTVLDLSGGKISGVGYNSVAPISEQLKSLRLPLGETTTLNDFLGSLRGSKVQVRSGVALTSGRLLSIEEKITKKGPEDAPVEIKSLEIAIVTDTGEIRTFPVTAALSVRVADHDLSEEITKYLNLVSSARNQDLRLMNISRGLGHWGQHRWRRLEGCGSVTGSWISAVVHPGAFAALLHATSCGRVAGSSHAYAANARGNNGRNASTPTPGCAFSRSGRWSDWRSARWIIWSRCAQECSPRKSLFLRRSWPSQQRSTSARSYRGS